MKKIYKMQAVLLAACVFTGLAGCGREKSNIMTITNVSYDATREFYESYNEIFKSYYEEKYGEPVNVIQSHAGSGSQARSVVEGCNADVVTLALEHDISLIEKTGLIDSGWKQEYDNDSAPYTSTMVFLVRKGNEKNIKDWDDLIKDGVEVITPDPKSSGGACWNFLAALSYAREEYTDTAKQNEFIKKLYANVSCEKVYLVHRREFFRGSASTLEKLKQKENVEIIVNARVEEITGDKKIDGIILDNKTKLNISGLFAAVGMIPQTELLKEFGVLDESNYVKASEDTKTTVNGLFAAGDVRTKQLRQVVTAAADGANAIYSVMEYLRNI